MDVGMVASDPSTTASSCGGSDGRIQAVRMSPGVATHSMYEDDDDWADDWSHEWPDDWWNQDSYAEEWYDEDWSEWTEYGLLVAGVSCQVPSSKIQELMIDSGSQSTACSLAFAPDYAIDDSEKARLWDIQDQAIQAHGKKIVDVKFIGKEGEEGIYGSVKVDVSDVGRDVASMGRLLRAGFDMHFTNKGHDCWLEKDGKKTTIHEDDRRSDAPLYALRLEVLPPPGSSERDRLNKEGVGQGLGDLVVAGAL